MEGEKLKELVEASGLKNVGEFIQKASLDLVVKYLPELYEEDPLSAIKRIDSEIKSNEEGLYKQIEENLKNLKMIETLLRMRSFPDYRRYYGRNQGTENLTIEKLNQVLDRVFQKVEGIIQEEVNKQLPRLKKLGLKIDKFSLRFSTPHKEQSLELLLSKTEGFYSFLTGPVIELSWMFGFSSTSLDEAVKKSRKVAIHEAVHKSQNEFLLEREEQEALEEFQKKLYDKLTLRNRSELEGIEKACLSPDSTFDSKYLLRFMKDPEKWIKENKPLYSALNKVKKMEKYVEEIGEPYAHFLTLYLSNELDKDNIKSIKEKLRFAYDSQKGAKLFGHLIKKYNKMIKSGKNEEDAVKEIIRDMYNQLRVSETKRKSLISYVYKKFKRIFSGLRYKN